MRLLRNYLILEKCKPIASYVYHANFCTKCIYNICIKKASDVFLEIK